MDLHQILYVGCLAQSTDSVTEAGVICHLCPSPRTWRCARRQDDLDGWAESGGFALQIQGGCRSLVLPQGSPRHAPHCVMVVYVPATPTRLKAGPCPIYPGPQASSSGAG